ncbi:MAG: helix-turn-helix domain-containing protein [Gemmataceae bacterium]
MRFGERVRQLRQENKLTLRGLAEKIGVGFTYLSKVENEKLDFADYPSDDLIVRLAKALNAEADELLLMAQKIPPQIKKRVLQRPDAFRQLAGLNDKELDSLLTHLNG